MSRGDEWEDDEATRGEGADESTTDLAAEYVDDCGETFLLSHEGDRWYASETEWTSRSWNDGGGEVVRSVGLIK